MDAHRPGEGPAQARGQAFGTGRGNRWLRLVQRAFVVSASFPPIKTVAMMWPVPAQLGQVTDPHHARVDHSPLCPEG